MSRTSDWLHQAKKDLIHAEESKKLKHYEWACLAAQQAAEKALKALFINFGAEAWGHSLFRLLKKLPQNIRLPDTIIDSAKSLDKHYITTRYPNGFVEGTPDEYYTLKDAEEAIENARSIIEFCKDKISS
ncbi:MAG: HEPN domain-containing protein [Candidatus Hodarchaeales archaeon]